MLDFILTLIYNIIKLVFAIVKWMFVNWKITLAVILIITVVTLVRDFYESHIIPERKIKKLKELNKQRMAKAKYIRDNYAMYCVLNYFDLTEEQQKELVEIHDNKVQDFINNCSDINPWGWFLLYGHDHQRFYRGDNWTPEKEVTACYEGNDEGFFVYEDLYGEFVYDPERKELVQPSREQRTVFSHRWNASLHRMAFRYDKPLTSFAEGL